MPHCYSNQLNMKFKLFVGEPTSALTPAAAAWLNYVVTTKKQQQLPQSASKTTTSSHIAIKEGHDSGLGKVPHTSSRELLVEMALDRNIGCNNRTEGGLASLAEVCSSQGSQGLRVGDSAAVAAAILSEESHDKHGPGFLTSAQDVMKSVKEGGGQNQLSSDQPSSSSPFANRSQMIGIIDGCQGGSFDGYGSSVPPPSPFANLELVLEISGDHEDGSSAAAALQEPDGPYARAASNSNVALGL